jgi:dihydroorotate dehydrogenase (NAD+) catalytic subunit
MGGISTGEDAVEMLLAGADIVSVGTALFRDPFAAVRVTEGIKRYLEEHGIENVSEISGKVLLN